MSFNSFPNNFFSISIISHLFAKRSGKNLHMQISNHSTKGQFELMRELLRIEIVFHFHGEMRSAILWFFNWKAILLFDSWAGEEREIEKKSSNDDDGVKSIFSFNAIANLHNRLQKKWTRNNDGSCKGAARNCNQGSFLRKLKSTLFPSLQLLMSSRCIVSLLRIWR